MSKEYNANNISLLVWRNLLTILSALIINNTFINFRNIYKSLHTLTEFNKLYESNSSIFIVAVFVTIYLIKNVHGMLLTLFNSPQNICDLSSNKLKDILHFYSFTLSLLFSLLFLSHLLSSEFIYSYHPFSHTFIGRSSCLMLLIFLPTLIYLIFDLIYVFSMVHNKKSFLKNIISKKTFDLKSRMRLGITKDCIEEYKKMWIFEDIFSVFIVLCWVLSIYFLSGYKIFLTYFTLFLLLFINSVFDYIFNFNFFFRNKSTQS